MLKPGVILTATAREKSRLAIQNRGLECRRPPRGVLIKPGQSHTMHAVTGLPLSRWLHWWTTTILSLTHAHTELAQASVHEEVPHRRREAVPGPGIWPRAVVGGEELRPGHGSGVEGVQIVEQAFCSPTWTGAASPSYTVLNFFVEEGNLLQGNGAPPRYMGNKKCLLIQLRDYPRLSPPYYPSHSFTVRLSHHSAIPSALPHQLFV